MTIFLGIPRERLAKSDREDTQLYVFSSKILEYTARVLREYGSLNPPREGMVYWSGENKPKEKIITTAFAPETRSGPGYVTTTYESNSAYVRYLSNNKIMHIAQVHSHPKHFIDHSCGDDKMAVFKVDGLLSIVVPDYCITGRLSLPKCGVHRYEMDRFVRLSKSYVRRNFVANDGGESVFEDMRN